MRYRRLSIFDDDQNGGGDEAAAVKSRGIGAKSGPDLPCELNNVVTTIK
jgi:hypothetical protein